MGRRVLPLVEGACSVNRRGRGGLLASPQEMLTQGRVQGGPAGLGRRTSQVWHKDRGYQSGLDWGLG